ncbi:Maf family protein [Thalassotalea profundi]|uniref:7-methyl-GTP pyrophosphatase n=1 Tax=Thalassotalea profundi TaxID=2036687 RepID=A0ABQ3IQR2_9GAMM|nr:nucleoside triphosphate pyrophosphatase [Thalassotalea profundi]GHE90600.1 Maf-like protein [Thalassotalea profundi]
MKTLVLGSTSPFRQSLLEKLNLPFITAKPDIDETALVNETPTALVERLAIEKAKAVALDHRNALIIGSDQVAVCEGEILGKPHTIENAIKQLTMFSNKCITFYTGLCVYDSKKQVAKSIVEPFHVHFKTLSKEVIKNYVLAEMPLNCAGSFKSEGLGICLFERLEGDDPNSLIGLPLIKLTQLLAQFDVDVLALQASS